MLSSSNLWVKTNYNNEDSLMTDQIDPADSYWDELGKRLEYENNFKDTHQSRMDIIGQNGNDGLHYEDPAVNPSHYTKGNIECIAYITETLGTDGTISFCQGNVTKYLHRWKDKNGVQDLEKAQWYLNKMIEIANTKS